MCNAGWCDVCGNEMDRMGPNRVGCLSCYISSGPDWRERWLADCAAATMECPGSNIVPLFSRMATTAHA